MINTLDDYIFRSLPEWGGFGTNPNLRLKADEHGNLLPFFGNTAVFLLDEGSRREISRLRENLYEKAGWMLAAPLTEDTFHMTLHDLENGPMLDGDLAGRMALAQERAAPLLESWRGQAPLHMEGTWTFNMVGTSIVLGLRPSDGDSHRRLSRMYGRLEEVKCLGYAMTPHITLAYYRPGWYDEGAVRVLRSALGPVGLKLELRMEDLVLQEFTDMNHYKTVHP